MSERCGGRRRWVARCGAIGALWLVGPHAATAADASYVPGEVLVRFRAEGPHALLGCAQALAERGDTFQSRSADGSDSLDRLRARFGVGKIRALFRRPGDRAAAEQRDALRTRLQRARRMRAAGPALEAGDLAHVYRLRLARAGDVERAAAAYRSDPHVVWAQPNFLMEMDFEPDDPFFASSGSWGQPQRDLWGLLRIRAPEAWDTSRGDGVVAAVVDTGLDYEHPDIAANVWINPGEDLDGDGRVSAADLNGIDDDGNGFVDDLRGFDFANSVDADGDGAFDGPDDVLDADPFDDHGHGTHVAGSIAAIADNGIGVAGVAPRARIMALKGFKRGEPSPIAILARAMLYAIDNGAQVINNSWSCGGRCPSNPVMEEMVRVADAAGVVVVTSAGNRRDDIVFQSPENMRETIVVAAHTEDDSPADFTNFGLLLDVTAPGAGSLGGQGYFPRRGILSLLTSDPVVGATGLNDEFVVAQRYLRWAGTSMSSPHVAGVVALLLAARPNLSPEDVRALLRLSADDLAPVGHDRDSGAGMVDAAAALALELPGAFGAFTSPAQGAILSQRIGRVALLGSASGPAFARYQISVGEGGAPSAWQPIAPAVTSPVDAGTLAVWQIDALDDGPYTLRLEVDTRAGVRITEFLQLSLERNVPTQISSAGPSSFAPAISGDRVVWESARPASADPDEAEAEGLDLFVTDLRRGVEYRVAAGPGDQHAAAIDGDRVAWLDGGALEGDKVRHCSLDRSTHRCAAQTAAADIRLRQPPVVSGGRIAWIESNGAWRLVLCELRGRNGACLPRRPVDAAADQLEAFLDGDQLFWSQRVPAGWQVMHCQLVDAVCTPRPVDNLGLATGLVASGDWLAWVLPGRTSALLSCQLNFASDRCDPALVGFGGPSTLPAISGRRLVWHAPGSGGDLDIFFCERDRVSGTCPIQRLTGSAADQQNPDIDGVRVVWEDRRLGSWQIFGLELPNLEALPDRSVREGQLLVVPVSGSDPSGGALALSARRLDGGALESLGASFVDRGNGRGELRWRPERGSAGPYALTVTGVTAGRLETRQSFRVEVREAVGLMPPSGRTP
jgi:beta propeller repeat protein